jgi:hypothetical protein
LSTTEPGPQELVTQSAPDLEGFKAGPTKGLKAKKLAALQKFQTSGATPVDQGIQKGFFANAGPSAGGSSAQGILGMSPDKWKQLQRKFGISEV